MDAFFNAVGITVTILVGVLLVLVVAQFALDVVLAVVMHKDTRKTNKDLEARLDASWAKNLALVEEINALKQERPYR